jgi:class 3 adenylate cyclase
MLFAGTVAFEKNYISLIFIVILIDMPLEKKLHRLDFVFEIEKIIEDSTDYLGVRVIMIPNPERYELGKNSEGVEGYFDKFNRAFIPLEELKKAIPQLEGMPIYANPPKIANIDDYIRERLPHISIFFEGKDTPYQLQDASEVFLSGLERDKARFVILCIDLKGSTKMSQALTLENNAQVIQVFSREMALLVDKFNGFVLKYVGDGLIAYFPEPNLIQMSDNAVDCAACMARMIVTGINPILKQRELPELSFRIGLDSGEAIIATIGADSVKVHKDLISETMNISAKIQAKAGTNQILIGESTAEALHTSWRKRIKKVELADWEYKNKTTGEVYPIYSVN